MTQQPQQPQDFEQTLRQNIQSLSNADDLVRLALILHEIDAGVNQLDQTVGAIWGRLDDDKSVSARAAERVKRWSRQVRSQLDALERQMDRYQP